MNDLLCPLLMLGLYVFAGSLFISQSLDRIARALEERNRK